MNNNSPSCILCADSPRKKFIFDHPVFVLCVIGADVIQISLEETYISRLLSVNGFSLQILL